MKLRFYNASVLTEAGKDLFSGEVHTDGNKITYVGTEKGDGQFDREINLGGNLIMPSFKNAHTHSAMTFLRSYADDLPLNDWLFKQVFPMEDKLTPDDVYELTKLAALEYYSGGTTAAFDMYFFPDSIAQAAIDTGLRLVLCGAVSGGDNQADYDSALSRLEDYVVRFNNLNPLVSFKMGFHAEYTTHISILKGIAELAKKYKQPLYTHNSETANEVQGCIERHGMTPTALMESLDMFEYGGGGFHCVHMTNEDLDIFKKRGLYVVTNPCSNCKLASGIAPLAKMNEMGIGLAIGTDGPASNNALDMFREMYLASVLQKVRENDASAMPADAVLRAATSGGALAMGLNDCVSLSEGSKADMVVIDMNRPNMQPVNNVQKNLVFAGTRDNVKMTIANGVIVYEDGKFPTLDAEKIYAKANEIM
ncbi:MAG: amidohydrolase, partial [Oscillospiraceae bacterium]|nr:amidohydrolase [Oscillospiraceae bacterium]